MIPEAAVEAAAKVLDPQTMSSGGALAEKFKAETREEARRILEAAAPHMLAAAWDEGEEAGHDNSDSNRGFNIPHKYNPYRPTA